MGRPCLCVQRASGQVNGALVWSREHSPSLSLSPLPPTTPPPPLSLSAFSFRDEAFSCCFHLVSHHPPPHVFLSAASSPPVSGLSCAPLPHPSPLSLLSRRQTFFILLKADQGHIRGLAPPHLTHLGTSVFPSCGPEVQSTRSSPVPENK